MLGLGYPGGPRVEAAARDGDPARFAFPRPLTGQRGCDFSFSGLKTAVRHRILALGDAAADPATVADLCASFQAAAADSLADRTGRALDLLAAEDATPTALVVAGGVAANLALRARLARLATARGLPLVAPPLHLCGDNAVMIAWAAIERLRLGPVDDQGGAGARAVAAAGAGAAPGGLMLNALPSPAALWHHRPQLSRRSERGDGHLGETGGTLAGLLAAGAVMDSTPDAPVGREALPVALQAPTGTPKVTLRLQNGQVVTLDGPPLRPADIDPTCHGYGPGAGGSFKLVLPVAEELQVQPDGGSESPRTAPSTDSAPRRRG